MDRLTIDIKMIRRLNKSPIGKPKWLITSKDGLNFETSINFSDNHRATIFMQDALADLILNEQSDITEMHFHDKSQNVMQ